MAQQFDLDPPAPWDDPEFARFRSKKPGVMLADRRAQKQIGALGLIIALIWMGLLLDPLVRPLVVGGLLALGLTLGVLLGAMGLGIVGTGLFAVGDRLIAWVRQGSRWPEE